MALHPAQGGLGIPCPDRLKDLGMGGDGGMAQFRRGDVLIIHRVADRFRHRLHQRDQRFIAAGARDCQMPVEVDRLVALHVIDRGDEFDVQVLDLFQLFGGVVSGGQCGKGRFHGDPAFQQGFQPDTMRPHEKFDRTGNRITARQGDHRSARASDLGADQAFGFQHPQRVADRGAAEPGIGHQLPFVGKKAAGSQATGHDHLAQLVGQNVGGLGHRHR